MKTPVLPHTIAAFLLLQTSVAISQPAPAVTPEQRFYSTLTAAAQGNGLSKTDTAGSPTGTDFSDTHASGGILVGFDLWKSNFQNNLIVGGICPIFQTASSRVRGPKRGRTNGTPVTIEAKPDFAVAGIVVKSGGRVDGLEVVFMRVNHAGVGLDSAGSYKSEWFGGRKGGRETRLVPNQQPIIGIFGGSGGGLDRLGLLYYDRK